MTEMEIKEQICDVCHKMWQLGWVAANDGNVSVKLPDGNFICTPTGISKSFITPEKLVKNQRSRRDFGSQRRLSALLGNENAHALL